MKGDFLPDTDNIARLCGGSHIDPETGSPGPGAFMLKETDNDQVSVKSLEYLKLHNRSSEINEVRSIKRRTSNRIR